MEEVTGMVEVERSVSPSETAKELRETSSLGEPTIEKKSSSSRVKKLSSMLRELDWESIVIIACLCVAYLLCNASYSIVSPFFPKEASN